jgi:ADP-ribose pyrophosphatase YjhB (NUDIX family)
MFGAQRSQRHDWPMSRRDYWHDPAAPKANSLVVAVSAVVLNESGEILMIERTDSGKWSIPGGGMEPGETVTAAVRRELLEETGYKVRVDRLVGVFADPEHIIEFSDGEVRQEFSICFRGAVVGGRPRTSSESSQVVWLSQANLVDHDIHPSIHRRIEAALTEGPPYFT